MEGCCPSLSTVSRNLKGQSSCLSTAGRLHHPPPGSTHKATPTSFLHGCDSSDWLLPTLAYSRHRYIGGIFFLTLPSLHSESGSKNSSLTGLECSALMWVLPKARLLAGAGKGPSCPHIQIQRLRKAAQGGRGTPKVLPGKCCQLGGPVRL